MSTDDAAAPPRTMTALHVIAWGAFGLAIATNLWGLYAPSQPGPPIFPGFDKIAHFGSFALVMLTGLLAGVRPRLLAIVLAVHAVLSEVVQATMLPGRSGDVADLVADLGGVAAGWLLWRGVRRWREGRSA